MTEFSKEAYLRNRPALFQEIVENQAAIDAALDEVIPLLEVYRQLQARKKELIKAAERTLSWNTDKGGPARSGG